MEGWISLHRKFLDWEWYDDINTKSLFIHCLLKANHKGKKWRGVDIKKGSFITSRSHLSSELKLSEQQVRTALKKLESTNEITIKTTKLNTLVSIINWSKYQDSNQGATKEQPSSNQGATTTNNDNKGNKENNINTFFEGFKELTGKNVRVVDDKTKRQFKARIKEGYTMDDILKAVKNCHGDKYHIENPQFLTMEFITRSDKLQKYVNADKSHSLKEDENLPSHLQGMVF